MLLPDKLKIQVISRTINPAWLECWQYANGALPSASYKQLYVMGKTTLRTPEIYLD